MSKQEIIGNIYFDKAGFGSKNTKVPRLPRKGGTPGRTSDPLAVHAEATGRAAEGPGHWGDARAYIRPLAEHQVPRLPRKRASVSE